jgi:hypothetical protein
VLIFILINSSGAVGDSIARLIDVKQEAQDSWFCMYNGASVVKCHHQRVDIRDPCTFIL